MNEEANHRSQAFSDLEAQLRRLPAPAPSPDLERRLLAGIPPSPVVSARSDRRARWIVPLATVAALVMAAVGLGLFSHRRAGSAHDLARRPAASSSDASVAFAASSRARLNNSSPELILGTTSRVLGETKPCNILPSSQND